MVVKKISELILMCYLIMMIKVDIFFEDDGKIVLIIMFEVVIVGKMGVEMEVFMVVIIVVLIIYDMCKVMDKGMWIEKMYLVEKIGGKSGIFKVEV